MRTPEMRPPDIRLWSMRVIGCALAVIALTTGCTRDISGTAQPDPHGPATKLTEDGYGILAGDPEAPIQLELFTEPQCTHCADLQKDFGNDIARYMTQGRLAITYRPLTFLDPEHDGDSGDHGAGHSARVSNALFLAAGPQTSARVFQLFVEDLWSHQEPGGKGPSDSEIADLARESGVPGDAVEKMKSGTSAVNIADMAEVNFEYLYEVNPLQTGTPTVYDLKKDDTVDIYDDNWLSALMSRS
ncbi:MAG: thioredoxin domain-containing protein [Mycobacterium sp.]